MRMRQAAVTAVGALALLLSAPTPAIAASGDFLYKTSSGQEATLADPQSGVCINLDGTSEQDPGHSPRNFTDATATVFLDTDCNGDVYYVMNPGKKLGDRLKLRSVIFS
ncbi:hypothetical protein [Kitasatospora viridis]|uniref:Peptidase inhibitor family I36 n=1 Tax=Kitasatospora viridis TaxID=281105 RepID=A0A561UDC5_9ACTN|nr:hypothetical protein [Kitasatospora viridis]TWF97335.1 hypothetical protein FHX73_111115 [Kitasatospora viridis]